MAVVQRYSDPFGDIVDDLFKGFFVRPVVGESVQPAQRLKVEVTEDDKAYKVAAEIPGVKKEDINITVDGDQVTITAEVKQEKEAKEGGRVVHSERYYGKLARSFRLGQEIDQEAIEARYQDGVLGLTLPKRTTERAKQITIQ